MSFLYQWQGCTWPEGAAESKEVCPGAASAAMSSMPGQGPLHTLGRKSSELSALCSLCLGWHQALQRGVS